MGCFWYIVWGIAWISVTVLFWMLCTNATWVCIQPVSNKHLHYQCVVSAYRENLSWLSTDFLPGHPSILVYSKHSDTAKQMPYTISLPNVGRCDHTYLYHIVKNYDQLQPITLFVTGSAFHLPNKRKVLTDIIFPRLAAYPSYRCLGENSYVRFWFSLSQYKAQGNKTTTNALIPAEIRPFGKWWAEHFPTLPVARTAARFGVFATTNYAIRSVPLATWEKLLYEHEVGDNVEVGHFMERTWYTLLSKGFKESSS